MPLVSNAREFFAHGGSILKRKEWMKSPVTGSMALALENDVDIPTWQLVGSLCLVVGAFWTVLGRNQTVSLCEQQGLENCGILEDFVPNSKCPWSIWPTPASHPAQLHHHRYPRQLLWWGLGMAPWASFPGDLGHCGLTLQKREKQIKIWCLYGIGVGEEGRCRDIWKQKKICVHDLMHF